MLNKDYIKQHLSNEDIYMLLDRWGANPTYGVGCIISDTICHNKPHEGSHKLYYYYNSQLFICYTACEEHSFDIFELVIKVMNIQRNLQLNLYQAMQWIVYNLNIGQTEEYTDPEQLADWSILDRYKTTKTHSQPMGLLKEFDPNILSKFQYDIVLTPWLEEGISAEVLDDNDIGYYLGADQITIPHYDEYNRLVGIRGRYMNQLDCELFGKYRPLYVNGILYNHPLGLNLYHLNKSQDMIKYTKKAIVFESEKSCLKYSSLFGEENDCSVACCGSNLSAVQVMKLAKTGAAEIIIAFDRQFQQLGDPEFKRWTKKLTTIANKYKPYATISFMFDKYDLLNYKSSPIDEGKEKFLTLYKKRIII